MNDFAVLISQPLIAASTAIRPCLTSIAFAFTATLLAIFGNEINGWFKELVKELHFLVRILAFMGLVAFGYGAATVAIAHTLARLLSQAGNIALSPIVLAALIAIGVLAEHKKHI